MCSEGLTLPVSYAEIRLAHWSQRRRSRVFTRQTWERNGLQPKLTYLFPNEDGFTAHLLCSHQSSVHIGIQVSTSQLFLKAVSFYRLISKSSTDKARLTFTAVSVAPPVRFIYFWEDAMHVFIDWKVAANMMIHICRDSEEAVN